MPLVDYSRDGRVATIRLNRPDRLNAFTAPMLDELREAWQRYEADDGAWVAVFTGAGRAFCAGADRSWFTEALAGNDHLGAILDYIRRDPYWSGRLNKPTIVAVNGYAIGGGLDLVLRADLRIAGESAVFWLPEVERGNIVVLDDNLPHAIAAELIAGFKIPARRAYEVGMLNRVVPDERLLDAATELAEELLARPPLALRYALGILRDAKNQGMRVSNDLLRVYTTELSRSLMGTEDWREAVDAMLEKRKAEFKGR